MRDDLARDGFEATLGTEAIEELLGVFASGPGRSVGHF